MKIAGQYYQKRMELIKSEPELVANKKNMEHLQIFES